MRYRCRAPSVPQPATLGRRRHMGPLAELTSESDDERAVNTHCARCGGRLQALDIERSRRCNTFGASSLQTARDTVHDPSTTVRMSSTIASESDSQFDPPQGPPAD